MMQRWTLLVGVLCLAGCPAGGAKTKTKGPARTPADLANTAANPTTKSKEPASEQLAKSEGDAPLPRAFARAGRRLTATERNSIYTEWFAQPYSYMFDRRTTTMTVLGGSYGTFLAGVDGIVLYGGLAVAIAKAKGLAHRGFYDLTPITALSGLPLHRKKAATLDDFSRFNPALVRWGYQNLLPEPQDTLGNASYQLIYTNIFARCFRLFAEARVELRRRGAAAEQAAYLTAMKAKGFDGLAYQEKRFAGALASYRVSNNSTNMTPAMAIGFWVRRRADGTDGELWTGLGKLLARYDSAFWRGLLQRSGAGAW